MIDWLWPHFPQNELVCKCCGSFMLVPEFMNKLEALRLDYGKPMMVVSGYRCSKHNAAVSETGLTGPHTTGQAVDIRVYGKDAFDLMHLAMLHGFTGIGVSQKGAVDKRFLHLDTVEDGGLRPRVWSY